MLSCEYCRKHAANITASDVREWLRARPFVPFRILLCNGSSDEVHHPDEVRITTGAVWIERNGRQVVVATDHMVDIEPLTCDPVLVPRSGKPA